MKRFLFVTVLFVACLTNIFAVNDGVFYAQGGTLVPLQETQVQLKKELLQFFVKDFQFMDVEIDFEFYNPGKAKTVTVGFVTPPTFGDVDENASHPRISRFTVFVNGKSLDFKIKKLKDTSFKNIQKDVTGEDYVYYFSVTFKPGLNKIRHTYRFQGGASVETQRDFEYQITTGKRWANKQIDDFELRVYLDRGIFYVPLSFQKTGRRANWQIVGRGTFSKPQPKFFGDDVSRIKLVQIQNGYLSLKEKRFRPDLDIGIGEYNWAIWYSKMCRAKARCPEDEDFSESIFGYFREDADKYATEQELAKLSREKLKLLRNFPYAIRGYDFKTRAIKSFYSQFFWYKPNSNLKLNDVTLSTNEEAFVEKLLNAEKRK